MLVQEYGCGQGAVRHGLPFTAVDATLTAPPLNRMLDGTGLPRLSEDAIEAMIARDALRLLGLA